MATFTTYGHTFTVPDRYFEGHVMTANEAAALNQLLAENISHMVRNGPLSALSKGDKPTEEMIAAATALIAERAPTYSFGAPRTRGESKVVDPVQIEALSIARALVRDAIKKKGLRLAKKGEPVGEGEYPFDAYESKIAEVALMEKVQNAAKKAVAARNNAVDIDIAA